MICKACEKEFSPNVWADDMYFVLSDNCRMKVDVKCPHCKAVHALVCPPLTDWIVQKVKKED